MNYKTSEGSGCMARQMEIIKIDVYMHACACFYMYLGLAAGGSGRLTDFSHFLEGKVACTVASGDCSSETDEQMKSINPCCYYLPAPLKAQMKVTYLQMQPECRMRHISLYH